TGPEGHIARHVTRQTGRQTRRSARPVRDPSLIGYSPGYQTSRPRWGRRSVSEGDRTPPVPNRLREHRLARGLDQWAVAERINALTEDGTPLDEKAVSRHERGLHKPRRFYRQLYCELYQTTEEELWPADPALLVRHDRPDRQ